MSEDDLDGLTAFLALLQRELQQGARGEAAAWVRELEAGAGGLEGGGMGLLQLLFQLVAAAVPSRLKAALFETITVFAADAESALQVWALLDAAQVCCNQAPRAGGGPFVKKLWALWLTRLIWICKWVHAHCQLF